MNDTTGSEAGTVERARAGLADLLQTLRSWHWFETLRTLRQRFREDRLGQTAGSLTFTTLIALVPLVTVMLAVFSAFPMFAGFETALQKYFLHNLVPEGIAKPVLRALTQFAGKARSLGTLGLLLLLATALALVLTIDRTLNGIWRVRQPRPLGQRVLVYWTALTLGPLALGASLTITSLVVSASRGLVDALDVYKRQPQGPTATAAPAQPADLQAAWLQAVRHLLASTEDVGERFAERARRMHYGEEPLRGIRGQATPEDRAALLEEGIETMAIPVPHALKGPVQ